ncbi:MAG TPA: hypothetical protein VGO11_19790 [Chthoniobacteraceae bacterium]|jgi:DNA polymerase/3'-5' exonuclease PolX|nr:hypothetical protein [Chthoniobacteraceae bacterium]
MMQTVVVEELLPALEEKPKVPRQAAIAVARELLAIVQPHMERVTVAGSLRRLKQEVGDIELLFIPKVQAVADTTDLFRRPVPTDVSGLLLDCLASSGYLAKRLNRDGAPTWGPLNKLAVHTRTGIAIDFFATDAEKWFNALVFRTGGKRTNLEIAARALDRGWTWNAYGAGFSRQHLGRAEAERMESEEAVFRFVGLPYQAPQARK